MIAQSWPGSTKPVWTILAFFVTVAVARFAVAWPRAAGPRCSAQAAEEKPLRRVDLVVLEWTNPGCPVVQRHYRDGLMPALQKECADKGIVWLTINSTNPKHQNYQTPDALKSTYSDWKAVFTALLMDPDGKAGKAFGAKTTPHMFVIDKEGKLVYSGAADDDPQGAKETRTSYVKPAVDSLIKGEPVGTSATKPYGCSVKYAE